MLTEGCWQLIRELSTKHFHSYHVYFYANCTLVLLVFLLDLAGLVNL